MGHTVESSHYQIVTNFFLRNVNVFSLQSEYDLFIQRSNCDLVEYGRFIVQLSVIDLNSIKAWNAVPDVIKPVNIYSSFVRKFKDYLINPISL